MAKKPGRKIRKLTDDQIFEQMTNIYAMDELVAMILRYLVLRDEIARRHGGWLKARAKMNQFLHRRNIAAEATP